MASTYFTLPSFARAKKNKDELEKKGATDPVLNDEDEKFLAKITSHDSSDTPTANDGSADKRNDDVVIFPGKQGASASEAAPATWREARKNLLNDLPSQEEAEAATKGFQAGTTAQAEKDDKRSWKSYVQNIPAAVRSAAPPSKDGEDRTWAEYASSIVPGKLSLPASWTKSKDKDAKPEIVYKEDGTVDEVATKEKQEKEVSVLLDDLSLSSINNRVFSFSQETHKIFERFVQVLKDTMNGVPTAYDDMEKLMKDAGPTIEKQWNAMPPFIQTLVKSLPAKLSATLGPGILAATEKPGFDAKAKTSKDSKGKKKRFFKIPALKSLVKTQGLAAGILRNIMVFLETRFPFLVGATNVVLSLSVMVLMFVFYYCWKRGREVRLEKEQLAADGKAALEKDDDDEIEVEMTSSESDDDADIARSVEEKAKIISQKDPAAISLPTSGEDKQ